MEIRLRTALAWRTVDPLQQHCSRNVGALQHLNAVDRERDIVRVRERERGRERERERERDV